MSVSHELSKRPRIHATCMRISLNSFHLMTDKKEGDREKRERERELEREREREREFRKSGGTTTPIRRFDEGLKLLNALPSTKV